MQVLGGTEISGEVLRLIDSAQKQLILISPYFDPWPRLHTAILSAISRGVKVILLVRGGVDRAKQEAGAQELKRAGVLVTCLDKLHAKAYVSETQLIVTSLNLLKSSALDSWEIAMRFDRATETSEFDKVFAQILPLLQRADAERALEAKGLLPKAAPAKPAPHPLDAALMGMRSSATKAPARARVGACIRCGGRIPFNAERPLCGDCFASWAKFANPDYKESHCHACGKEKSTTFAKPLCRGCWDAVG